MAAASERKLLLSNAQNARLRNIASLFQSNREMIGQLNSKRDQMITLYKYRIRHKNGNFSLNEETYTQSVQEFLNSWQCDIKLQPIPDIFNYQINFTCRTYSEIQSLNRTMMEIAKKYELFGDSERAQQDICKIEFNFEQLKQTLQEMIQFIQTGGGGHLSNIQAQIDNINKQLNMLRSQYKTASFQ